MPLAISGTSASASILWAILRRGTRAVCSLTHPARALPGFAGLRFDHCFALAKEPTGFSDRQEPFDVQRKSRRQARANGVFGKYA